MRWQTLFTTTSPSGHASGEVLYQPRPDGSCTLRIAQGEQFLDATLTARQADALATALLNGVFVGQQQMLAAAAKRRHT